MSCRFLFAAFAGCLVAGAVSPSAWAIDLDESPFEVIPWRQVGALAGLAQTSDGYLWMLSVHGLFRFDGVQFVEVTHASGSIQARRVAAASDDSVWLGLGAGELAVAASDGKTFVASWVEGQGGLVRVKHGQAETIWAPAPDPAVSVWALASDRADGVWVGTEAGVVHVNPAGTKRFPVRGQTAGALVDALTVEPDGSVWAGSAAGLSRLRGDGFLPAGIDEPVTALTHDGHGALLVGTSSAVYQVKDALVRRLASASNASALLLDRDRNLWIGNSSMLGRLDGDRLIDLPLPPGQANAAVTAALEDAEGSLWVASRSGGVAQVRVPLVRNIGPDEGLGGQVAFSILKTRNGEIWISHTGGVSRWDGESFTNWRLGTEFPGWSPRGIAEATDGSVFISSGFDLVQRKGGHFIDWKASTIHPSTVGGVFVDNRGDLWLAWENGDVTRHPGGQLPARDLLLTRGDGLCGGTPSQFLTRAAGGVWIASVTNGLGWFDGRRAHCLQVADGLPGNNVFAIAEDPDGALWISTSTRSALVRWKNGRMFVFGPEHGLPGGTIFNITDDGQGRFWFSSNRGVLRMPRAELDAVADGKQSRLDPIIIDNSDGMRSQECIAAFHPSAALAADGRLWVPTLQGLSIVSPPERLPRVQANPRVDELLVDGVTVDSAGPMRSGPLRFGPGPRHVELRFTAPSFLSPARLGFSYRLDPVDRDWNTARGLRSARYDHLPPGLYSFHVRAGTQGNRPAAIGHEVVLPFEVVPHLWQTWWFRVLAVVLLATAIGFGYRRRVRRIEGRYLAVQAERGRIARDLHDGLAQGFTAIGFLLDGVRLAFKDTPGPAREILEQARGILDRTQADTRRAIWNIRAETVGRPTLRALLERNINEAMRQSAARITLAFRGQPPPSAIIEYEVPRIVQEAITNALRHGQARNVEVDVECGAVGLSLTVKDDGKGLPEGFDPLAHATGFGILGMRERASRVGGQLTIHGGGGVEVRLEIPRAKLQAVEDKPT